MLLQRQTPFNMRTGENTSCIRKFCKRANGRICACTGARSCLSGSPDSRRKRNPQVGAVNVDLRGNCSGLYINGHDEDIDKFVEKSLKMHREIFDAIKNKDAEKAKSLARRHLLDDVEKGMKIGQTV